MRRRRLRGRPGCVKKPAAVAAVTSPGEPGVNLSGGPRDMSTSTSDMLGGATEPSSRSQRLRADGALALITSFWGITFVVVKDALGHGDPFSFLTLRFIVGAVVLSALAGRQVLTARNLRSGTMLGTFLFLGFSLQTVGLTTTTPSRSAFITGLCVLLVPLLSLVLYRKAPKFTSLLGVGTAAVGLYLFTQPDAGLGSGGLSSGDVLSLGGAVAYACHILMTERHAPKQGVMGLVAVQLWTVALLSALCLPFVERRVAWHPSFVGAVLVCGVFASAVAISLQTWGQARTTAVRAALIYSLESVFAALFSVMLGYETLGPREWLGGALILSGVLMSEVGAAAWGWWRARAPVR
ncbi:MULTISPECIES: DMT family transporter [Myxococcus]|uniref:DMT family transporter n=5 Tax=Myxococcaceae TaxID=31 RepID=UPI00139024DC|nr:DMT family transporter [Myxococcus sp. CA027]NOK02981.1 DMT family transporter [Myxococcus xanthus]